MLLAAALAFGFVKRMSTTYLVSTQRLYIRRGILSKRMQQTRIDRVQNVNTDQSLRERLLRVGTVDFDTAGTDDSEFRFVGIADPGDVVTAVDRAQREAAADADGLEERSRRSGEPPRARGAILPLATSLDGRQFSFQASLHDLELQAGGYVVLESDGPPRLGQVVSLRLATRGPEPTARRSRSGTRRARGRSSTGPTGRSTTRSLRAATPDEVRAWTERAARPRARLAVGELTLAPGVPLELDAGGFDRHTFLCGQSGSGKTYSLGLILERLLADTELRLVILDPNSDYVRLGHVRDGADPALAARYREVAGGVEVHSASGRGRAAAARAGDSRPTPRARCCGSTRSPTATSTPSSPGCSPRSSRRRWRRCWRATSARRGGSRGGSATSACTSTGSGRAASRARCSTRWRTTGPRCLVVDLGSLPTREEQALVAAAVLGRLWSRPARRVPMLVVIDEAHNVCPAGPRIR